MLLNQSKRKRKLLTLKTKVYIINKFESGEKISQISKNLNLCNSTVSSIVRDKRRIMAAAKNEAVLNSSIIIRKRHGIIAKTEFALKAWCEELAEQNIRLSQKEICTQAKTIFEGLKKEYGEAAKDDTFLASKGWFFRFKRRCEGNRILEIEEEENQEDQIEKEEVQMKKESIIAPMVCNMEVTVESTFSDYLKAILNEGLYTQQTIFNVDEISLYWKKMPEGSHLARQGQTLSGFNASKDRLTVLLGGNAAGDLKLKPLVIYRTENPRALHNKSKGGLPVIWKSNSTASMSISLFEDWFGHYFIPQVERYCYENQIPCKVILLIDSASYHNSTTLVDFDHRVKVIFLPSHETNSIQPMTQEISNKFKAIYTRRIFRQLVEVSKLNDVVTAEELWKEFNILDAIRIIVDSWTELTEKDWKDSWAKLFPSFSNTELITESEVNSLTEIVEEIVSLALDLDMKVDRKDIFNLLNSHNKEPTIEDLLEMQEFSTNEELDTQDPLLPEGAMTVENLTDAFSHIKLGLQILENIDVNEQRARTARIGVLKLLSAYEEILNDKVKCMARQESGIMPSTSNK